MNIRKYDLILVALKDQLEKYITRWNGLVKLYRTGKRVGLIAARTLGAEKCNGDVIVVLDAHCECVCFVKEIFENMFFCWVFVRLLIGFHHY